MMHGMAAASRGVYPADRASALAGVPKSTLYLWARTGPVVPSVSANKLKLWSWADLVALRAVYWLRHPVVTESRQPTSMASVRRLVSHVEDVVGGLGEAVATQTVILSVDPQGTPHLDAGDILVRVGRRSHQGVLREVVIDLLSPFQVEAMIFGPDLRRPRERLRIIPGKLSGEPHVAGTRIDTRALWALNLRGYDNDALRGLYPELSVEAIDDALDLERQLQQNLKAA